jgi:hypothetical protein
MQNERIEVYTEIVTDMSENRYKVPIQLLHSHHLFVVYVLLQPLNRPWGTASPAST